jgi:hypothetical protein
MPTKPRSIRRQAFNESAYPEVEGTRCVEIRIPDSDEYLAQLAGLITIATQRFQYSNKDVAQAEIVAGQWKNAYLETDWEQCMNCEDVQDCIENHEGTQNALRALMADYLLDNPAGSAMPFGEQDRTLAEGSNPFCDLDIVWSQSVGIVERINEFIVDILESLTEADTVAKVASVLASLPGVENFGITSVTELAQLLVSVPLASYNDSYDSAWYEALECEIFCMSRHDCEIKFSEFWNIIKLRVETEAPTFVPPTDFLNIVEWAGRISGFTSDLLALNKADLMFYFLLGGVAYGNVILNQLGVGQKAFDIALLLAADEPSNDWEVICLTCPEYEDIVIDVKPYPVTESGFTVDAYAGDFTGGDNIKIETPFTAQVIFPVNRRVHAMVIPIAFEETTGGYVTINGVNYDMVRGTHLGGSSYLYDVTVPDILTDTIDIQFVSNSETGFTFVVASDFTVNVWEL